MQENTKKNLVPIIGLTGPAGCGKSYIAKLLSTMVELCYISADDISRRQMQKGEQVYQSVVAYFGTSFLKEDDQIDRSRLAEYVFANPKELAILNSLTHPAVRQEIDKIIQNFQEEAKKEIAKQEISKQQMAKQQIAKPQVAKQQVTKQLVAKQEFDLQKKALIVIESAILVEAGYRLVCDEIWYVNSPLKLRQKRLIETRGYSMDRIENMKQNQAKEATYLEQADFVVENDEQDDGSLIDQLQKRLLSLF